MTPPRAQARAAARSTHPVALYQPAVPAVPSAPPIAVIQIPRIDWDYLIERRPFVLRHAIDLPAYLLLPEVRGLLATIYKAQSQLLFSTLWHTGARISEVLALTPASFHLDPRGAHVSLNTLKKRGRPKATLSRVPARMVPLHDPGYLNLLRTYLASHSLRPQQRLFPITRQAADARLRVIVETYDAAQLAAKQPKLSIAVSCKTFRHSFAVNCVLHGRPLPALQAWMGHSSIETTQIYTQVLTAETGHLMVGVEF